MWLTRRDRNLIYQAITLSKLNPAECDLEADATTARITHNLGSTFMFYEDNERSTFHVVANISNGSSLEVHTPQDVAQLVQYIQRWADDVALDSAVDYWEEMKQRRATVAIVESQDSANTPFTQDEQRQVAERLQEMKKQLREQFELTGEQLSQLDEKLDEAAEASTRMGRKDWLIYFLGSITALVVTATVTAGIGEHIFNLVIQGLIHLFTSGIEAPHILT